jgi:UDP-glucuronate 4-epimerase
MKDSILVTGSAGFIGSHLCERLLQLGFNVIGLDNFTDNYDPLIKRKNVQGALGHPNYIPVEGSILDTGLVDRLMGQHSIDSVVHLAALAGVRNSILTPLDYVDTDIKGTVVMLEACRRYGIKKFVFASSSSVYGSSETPFRESNNLSFQASPYAAAKYSGELFCRTWHQLYGIPILCLRFFTVYGPRQRPDMAIHIFTKAISEGLEVNIYGDGTSSRDYTYIDDVVDGILASIQHKCSFEVLNLGNSNAVDVLTLVGIIEGKLQKQAKLRFLPQQPGDVPQTFADISKAKALLGYTPKVGLEDGLERFIDWYRREKV